MYCRTEPKHPKQNSNGLYPLHRVLMENKLGRILKDGEVVHHKDEDKHNNDIANLEVMTNADHTGHHHPVVALVNLVCPCGKEFSEKPHMYRLRLKRSKRKVLYCSLVCSRRWAQTSHSRH